MMPRSRTRTLVCVPDAHPAQNLVHRPRSCPLCPAIGLRQPGSATTRRVLLNEATHGIGLHVAAQAPRIGPVP